MTRHDLDDSSEHLLPRCSYPAANGAPPLRRQALRTGLARPFPNGAPDKTPTQPPFCSKLAVSGTAQVWQSHSRTAPPADHECWRTLARVGRQRRAGLAGPFPNRAAVTRDLDDSSERLLPPCSSIGRETTWLDGDVDLGARQRPYPVHKNTPPLAGRPSKINIRSQWSWMLIWARSGAPTLSTKVPQKAARRPSKNNMESSVGDSGLAFGRFLF